MVRVLGDVLLEVDAREADALRSGGRLDLDGAAEAEGLVVLRDLVVLRGVRIEVVLAVELAVVADLAAEHESGEDGQLDRLAVHQRQRAGIPEADRADVRVGRVGERRLAAAEHLRGRLELYVGFETDGDDEVHASQDLSSALRTRRTSSLSIPGVTIFSVTIRVRSFSKAAAIWTSVASWWNILKKSSQ